MRPVCRSDCSGAGAPASSDNPAPDAPGSDDVIDHRRGVRAYVQPGDRRPVGEPRQLSARPVIRDRRLAAPDHQRQLAAARPPKCSRRKSLITCIASLSWATASLPLPKGAKGGGRYGLRRLGAPCSGCACRRAFPPSRMAVRQPARSVQHQPGTVSVMPPECCPPSFRHRVRHGRMHAACAVEPDALTVMR